MGFPWGFLPGRLLPMPYFERGDSFLGAGLCRDHVWGGLPGGDLLLGGSFFLRALFYEASFLAFLLVRMILLRGLFFRGRSILRRTFPGRSFLGVLSWTAFSQGLSW